jgi:hypothetical protein
MAADSSESITPLAEISHGPSRFEQFLDENQKLLLALTVLLILGAAAWIIYSGVERSQEKTAGAALTKAVGAAELEKIVTDHAGTRAAGSAMLLLAEIQWGEGKKDAAIATLKDFTTKETKHPAHPNGLASLGAKLMAQGNAAEASSLFQQIISDPQARYLAPYAHLSLGDLAQSGGDLDKAATHFERVKKDFPESRFVDAANQRIESLRAKAPLEVEPPPAPVPDAKPATPVSDAMPAAGQPAVEEPANPAPATPEP